MPADRYEFRYGNFERELSLLDGARYRMNLDPSRAIDLEISGGRVAAEVVQLRIRVRGVGTRQIVLRVSNGRVPDTQLTVRLGSGSTHELDCPLTVADPQRPWVVVAIPDGRVGEGVEAFGTIATLREMGRSDAAA